MMDVPYKPERFNAAVEHYVAARVTYAPGLIAWLARETETTGKRVLDLGCGPGFIANEIAPHASQVLGLDPSPNMIDAARAVAAPNARFEIGSSEDLSQVERPIQLVTIGRAFHWMDREQTLRDLDELIAEGGAIALINDSPAAIPMNQWWREFNALAKSYAVLDEWNQHRASDGWIPHEEVLVHSTFGALSAISVYQRHVWSFQRLIRHTLSRSATTEELLGSRLSDFEAEARALLVPFGPEPWISLNQHIALIARRSAPPSPEGGQRG